MTCDRLAMMVLGGVPCLLLAGVIGHGLYGVSQGVTGYVCECGWMRQTVGRFVAWSVLELALLGWAMGYGVLGCGIYRPGVVMLAVPGVLVVVNRWGVRRRSRFPV